MINEIDDIFKGEKVESKPNLMELEEEPEEQQTTNENKLKVNELTEERKKNTIFIGNLALSTSKKEIKKHFKQYGAIQTVWERNLPTSNQSKLPAKAKVIL